MLDLARFDYVQLRKLEDDLGEIIHGIELAAKHNLTGFEPAELRLLAENVSATLDEMERLDDEAMRREYERSVI